MKKLFLFAALLFSASVYADDGGNFTLFQQHMRSYLASQGINTPITFILGITTNSHVDGQLNCEGIAEDVRCVETVNQQTINERPEAYLEYAAAHEVCHLKLKHYTFDVTDFITRGTEIELEADRCAFGILGEKKFFTGFTYNFYETEDPNHIVPEDALRKAVVNVYGPQPK